MADFPSTYYAAQSALSPRGPGGSGSANASDTQQPREDAVHAVAVTSALTTADFLPLQRVLKPGTRVIPEETRVRPSATTGNVTLKLQALNPDGTTTDLTTAVALTSGVITFAAASATSPLPELPVGAVLRLVPTAVGTAAALTYHVELATRIRGGA